MARVAPTGRQSGDLQLHSIAPDVSLYRGFFSNSAVLSLPGGVVVVDTQITPKGGQRLKQAIQKKHDRSCVFVINTHYHGDHSGGNAAFPEAQVVATDETARYIRERDGERLEYARTFGLLFQDVPPVRPPDRTFTGELVLDVGGDKLELKQLGRVETPDACVVWWPSKRVLCCGDGVATTGYPYLGVPFLDEGLQDDGQWIGFLEKLRALEPEILLAGHGTPIVGHKAVAARLDLLIALFRDLFAAVKDEMKQGTPVPELFDRVDGKLAHYARMKELEQNTVGQRFAIYRAYNSAHPERRGKGWWHDFRPSVIKRAPAAAAEIAIGQVSDTTGLQRWIAAVQKKDPPLALTMLEKWTERHSDDAAALGLLADVRFDSAAGVMPVVDATEWLVAAAEAAKAALERNSDEPLGLLNLGCLEIWSAMVLAQDMEPGIDHLHAALKHPLNPKQRRKAVFFLGKAHQYDGRDAESDRWLKQALPRGLRWLFPLVRNKLRAIP
jgi:glyoxylase-like metal-dependent hydrolase (beta-lactamase superfamily II)